MYYLRTYILRDTTCRAIAITRRQEADRLNDVCVRGPVAPIVRLTRETYRKPPTVERYGEITKNNSPILRTDDSSSLGLVMQSERRLISTRRRPPLRRLYEVMPCATISTVRGGGFVPRFPNTVTRLAQLLFRVVASACALRICVELSRVDGWRRCFLFRLFRSPDHVEPRGPGAF